MISPTSATSRAGQRHVKVNGADLYYQTRGSGPTLLMIHGTGADADIYDALAEELASDFTVVTYDRRGWSRSPRPSGWLKTSIEEQADDAAWLLKATGTAPAILFGSSSGGLTALDLALRHADVVRGAVLHEPSLFTTLPQDFVSEQFAGMEGLLGEAVANGGPSAGHRAFLDALAGQDVEVLAEAAALDRWLSNSELMFAYEFPGMLLGYRPDPAAIAAVHQPVRVMRATESMPINAAAAEWLAAQLKTELVVAPGAHLAYFSQPTEFAKSLRVVLDGIGTPD